MNLAGIWNGMWDDPMFAAVVNHLWQSTVVTCAAWVLAFALRKNHARVRYWVWFFASVKFLVPFSAFIEIGMRLRALIPVAAARLATASVVEQVAQPFAQGTVFAGSGSAVAAMTAHHESIWPAVLLAIWACGAVVVGIKWMLGWLRLRRAVKEAKPLPEFPVSHRTDQKFEWMGHAVEKEIASFIEIDSPSGAKAPSGRKGYDVRAEARTLHLESSTCENFNVWVDVPVLCSATLVEPGIVGVLQPVLLLPDGIVERLSDEQMRSILAHEMCHVRSRDNLTFAVHMMVEMLFWFFPLVWWIGARLIEERERACDESVIAHGGEAQVYAEGILNVCKFYVESPVACVAGVTGSDLKKRIVRIMSQHIVRGLDVRRKFLLAAAGTLAVALPLALGLVHSGAVIAETRAEDELANLPKFDVASIKPHKDEGNGMFRMGFNPTPAGLRAEGVPLQMIVRQAFGVSDDRLLNDPDWVKSTRYDLEAKVSPEDAPKMKGLTQRQRGLMLLPVLEDRFGLKFHHETRELNVYTLLVAKGGPKLKVAQDDNTADGPAVGDRDHGPMTARPGAGGPEPGKPGDGGAMPAPRPGQTFMRMSQQGASLEGRGMPIDALIATLSRELGATVIDKTGLTEKYDITLNFMPEFGARAAFGPPPPPPPSSGGGGGASSGGPESATSDTPPSLVDAIQQQLGLKLVQQKEPVDVIVIDHIEQPSAN